MILFAECFNLTAMAKTVTLVLLQKSIVYFLRDSE